jgi:hypothetical protein
MANQLENMSKLLYFGFIERAKVIKPSQATGTQTSTASATLVRCTPPIEPLKVQVALITSEWLITKWTSGANFIQLKGSKVSTNQSGEVITSSPSGELLGGDVGSLTY